LKMEHWVSEVLSEEDQQYFEEFSANMSTNSNHTFDDSSNLISTTTQAVLGEVLRSTAMVDTSTTPSNTTMCDFSAIKDFYHPIHYGWLAMLVCVLGTLFNLANILVLTHKDMRNPVNMILTGIAVADCLVMIEYIPFIMHMRRLTDKEIPKEETMSLGWGIFMLFHISFTVMIHTVSIFLTLALAIWRFIMIKFHSLATEICTMTRCRNLLFLAFVIPLFLTIPNGFASLETVYIKRNSTSGNSTSRFQPLYEFETSMFTINLWLYGVVMKLVPCLVLGVVTALLVHEMYKAEARSAALSSTRRPSCIPGSELSRSSTRRTRSTDRTTRLLIALLGLFLIAETPMGTLGLLSAIHGRQFYKECYNPLGDIMDMLALVNCSTNFLLYCFMSTQFRTTLCKMLNWKGRSFTVLTNSNMLPLKSTEV